MNIEQYMVQHNAAVQENCNKQPQPYDHCNNNELNPAVKCQREKDNAQKMFTSHAVHALSTLHTNQQTSSVITQILRDKRLP